MSHDCWDGGGSSFSSRGGVLSSLLPPVVEFDLAMAVAEMGVPFDDTEERTVFVSSISSHQGEGNDDIDKAAGEENAMRRLGYMGQWGTATIGAI